MPRRERKPYGTSRLGRDSLQELVRAGAEIRYYHPVHNRTLEGGDRSLPSSNHDKILVADGKVGVTGGQNIGADYFAAPADVPTAWRDTDVLLQGGAVHGLVAAVDRECLDEHVAPRVHDGVFGDLQKRDAELLGAYWLMELWLTDHGPVLDDPEAAAHELVCRAVARLPSEGITRPLDWYEVGSLEEIARDLVGHRALRGTACSRTTYKPHEVRAHILDRTAAVSAVDVDDFETRLVAAARSAKKRLLLQNPYVVLTEPMLKVLEEASARGVEITLVTNSPSSTDSALTQAFFLEDWPHILARLPTARILVFTGQRKLHAKVAVADDSVSLVSSYNLDLLSSMVNGEIGALMHSRAMAADIENSITADIADPANRVVELRIRKHGDGSPALVDGEPVIEVGPDQHLDAATRRRYGLLRAAVGVARNSLAFLASLRHPPLGP